MKLKKNYWQKTALGVVVGLLAVGVYSWFGGMSQRQLVDKATDPSNQTVEIQDDSQEKIDYDYGVKQEEFYEYRPISQQLPITTDNYELSYNSVEDKIVVVFSNSQRNLQDLKQEYYEEIVAQLEVLGADLSVVPLEWVKAVE